MQNYNELTDLEDVVTKVHGDEDAFLTSIPRQNAITNL